MFLFRFILLLSALQVQADEGFYSTRAYRVPSAVEQSGNSIVKILVIDPVSKQALGWGSGFVAEDSYTLWTAAHIFDGPLKVGMTLSLELYDVLGKKLFDTGGADTATLTIVGVKDTSQNSPNERDFAKIRLSRPLALRPISINSKNPTLGDDLYIVGFPAIDSILEASKTTYAQGIMQSRVTLGKLIKASEVNEELATTRTPAQIEKLDKAFSEKLLFIDSDGYFGQSGAPIFNDNGEAVGVFTAIFRNRENAPGQPYKTKGLGPSFSGILNR